MKKTSILFIIFALALVGMMAACGDSKKPNTNASTPGNRATQTTNPSSAPAGAQPPNMLGGANATVTVEEFADFQCPTCAQVHSVMKNVQAAYGSRIKFIFRSFPLTQIHKNAFDAAVAAESAGRQGKYWDMQNMLFQNQTAWSNSADARAVFNGYAETLGLDVERFKADMAGMETKERVQRDMERGRAMNINSTPTIFVNGQAVPFEQMNQNGISQIIDAELAKSPTAAQTPAQSSSPTAPTSTNAQAANTARPTPNANGSKVQGKTFTDQ